MAFISLKNVTLDFPIYGASTRSFKKQLIRLTTGGVIRQQDNEVISIRALDNLSFDFHSGEIIGLIGHNGAGKSTLLRVLAGIYEPSLGEIEIQGKVSSLLDISLGMNPESTGYENIFLSGIIRGLSRKKIAEKSKEIATFTELGDYLSMPIRAYSSGMNLRLAFSIASSLPSEILILDEVVGAGDNAFMQKAQKRLEELVHQSELVVLASHSKELIKKFCTKVLWMNAGKIAAFGNVDQCLNQYFNEGKW